jgi:hypothetical protein
MNAVVYQEIEELHHQDRSEGPSQPRVILDSLPVCSQSPCPFVVNSEARCILVMILFKFGDDLLVRFPAKTIASNHGPVLKKVRHSENDQRPRNQ